MDEPLPDLAEGLQVHRWVSPPLEGTLICDHNGMGNTPRKAAVGYGCWIPLQDLMPRAVAVSKPYRPQHSLPEITLRLLNAAHLRVELEGRGYAVQESPAALYREV